MLRLAFRKLYQLYKPSDFKPDDEHILSFSGPQITETLLNEFPDQDQKLMLDEWTKYSQLYYEKSVKLYDGAYELIKSMFKRKINFCINTNKHRFATEYTLKFLKLDEFNIKCICANDVKNLKPNPEGIFLAMEKFNIKNKEDVIYIGDSIFDYLTAKNAGVDFGFVSWSPRKLPSDSKVDVLINNFHEFNKEFIE